MPSGGHNKLTAEEHKRRGTYRADRHGDPRNILEPEEHEALSEYLERGRQCFLDATHGLDVAAEIAFLRAAEDALRYGGLLTAEYAFSDLASIAAGVYRNSFPRSAGRGRKKA